MSYYISMSNTNESRNRGENRPFLALISTRRQIGSTVLRLMPMPQGHGLIAGRGEASAMTCLVSLRRAAAVADAADLFSAEGDTAHV